MAHQLVEAMANMKENEALEIVDDLLAQGGGYIMTAGASMDDARPEDVRAMFEFTREYGVYWAKLEY